MKHFRYTVFALLLWVLPGCSNIFSTSLAPWAARDPSTLIPDVTADNVWDLIDLAEGDPDLSLELLREIGSAVSGASGNDRAELQAAGLAAAINASELGEELLRNLHGIGDLTGEAEIKALINGVLGSAGNLIPAGDTLAGMLPSTPSPGNPEFDAFAAAASGDDLAMAAAVLLASEAKKTGDNVEDMPGTYASTNTTIALAKALATAANNKPDVSDSIRDILGYLDLI
jgi:hypothetical protein